MLTIIDSVMTGWLHKVEDSEKSSLVMEEFTFVSITWGAWEFFSIELSCWLSWFCKSNGYRAMDSDSVEDVLSNLSQPE